MNSKMIGGIIVVLVIVAGIFLFTRNKSNDSKVEGDQMSASSAASVSKESGSIKSLIAAGKSQKCTFSTAKDNVSSEGTIYVGSGKMRGDFSVNTSESKSHMINDGTTSYMWTDDGKVAMKMAFDPKSVDKAADSNAKQSVDVDQNYDWSCESWKADNSKFDLPSGVTFMELPSLPAGVDMKASTPSSTDMSAIRKQACNSLSSPAKEQCLAAIK